MRTDRRHHVLSQSERLSARSLARSISWRSPPAAPVRTETGRLARADASSAAAAENLPRPLPSLSRSSWRRPSVWSPPRPGRTHAISPIFRTLPIPMPRRRSCGRCLRPRSDSRRSARSPSPRGRTVCRRRSYRCWLSSGRKSPSGSSSGCKPSMHRRPPISAVAIPFPSMTRRCGRCTRAASASSRIRSWACPARRRR